MTIERKDRSQETAFSAWVREHPELESKGNRISITDCDLWCHRFSLRDERRKGEATDIRDAVDHIMLVEIKTFFGEQRYAQRDTLSVIDALLRMACKHTGGRRKPVKIADNRLGNRPIRMVRCFGVHLLELSCDRPDNSDQMLWDKRSFIHESHLIELLRFERDPDSPMRILETRRHHKRVSQPQLGLVVNSSLREASE